jgi:hypothetical protein
MQVIFNYTAYWTNITNLEIVVGYKNHFPWYNSILFVYEIYASSVRLSSTLTPHLRLYVSYLTSRPTIYHFRFISVNRDTTAGKVTGYNIDNLGAVSGK